MGILAKNPSGSWSLEEHIIHGSSKNAWKNSPWISTTTDLQIAKKFDSGFGIAEIDLNSINPDNIMHSLLNFTRGSKAYHFSVWQREVTIFKNIPGTAIKNIKK